jgi:Bifunctional DNA primase/polymerase, N-terminal
MITLEAAGLAAARGWYVFPVEPNGKKPRVVAPGKRFPWATWSTNDPEKVMGSHWRPNENYGIAAKLSGLVVVDLDRLKPDSLKRWPEWLGEPGIRHGWDTLAALAERAGVTGLPWTYTVRTPGGGAHLYYLAPDGPPVPNRCPGPMIDIKAAGGQDGGYVVGPGSVIDGRSYEVTDDQDPVPLPAWLGAAIAGPQRPERPATTAAMPAAGTYGRLRGLVQHVLDGGPGDRNGRVHWAACRAAEMIRDGQVDEATAEQVLTEAALAAGLRGGEAEARRTIASGLRRGRA